MEQQEAKELMLELIRHLTMQGVILPSDLAKIIGFAYEKKMSAELEPGFKILDSLSGWCIDDELAIHWGINTLYERFRRHSGDAAGKKQAIKVAQELLDLFKEQGGNNNDSSVSKGNS